MSVAGVITSTSPAESSGSFICCPALPAASLPWFRLVVGIFVAAQTMCLGMTINLTAPDDATTLLLLQCGMLVATLVVLAILGLPLTGEAWRQLRQRRLTMELLFLSGILAALAISCWSMYQHSGPVYFEVVSILLVIYSIGQAITTHSRARAITATQAMLCAIAQVRRDNGQLAEITAITAGDRIRVMPGEIIPVDGVVLEGVSLVRTTLFNGQWLAGSKHPGDAVLAGEACEDGALLIRATSIGKDRRIDRMANMITSACNSSSSSQQLADRYVRYFLPAVTLVACGTLLFWGLRGSWSAGLFNALAVILVACPCAAGLATPLAVWTTIARLAEKGLLLKSAQAMERLAGVTHVIFDKTGTLADQHLLLRELRTAATSYSREQVLAILGEVEQHSNHPVARALRQLPVKLAEPVSISVQAIRILPAIGIEADIVLDGSAAKLRLTRREGATELTLDALLEGKWLATAVFQEQLRDSASDSLAQLQEMGLPVQIMTGDASAAADQAAALAPLTSAMTPEGKHQAITSSTNTRYLFVGDGVNDAPAMAVSHCSLAMACGAELVVETADGALYNPDLRLIPHAIELSRRTLQTIRTNFAWAVLYNMVGMTFAAMGWLHPVVASILMSLSSAIVAWRSFRLIPTAPRQRVIAPAQEQSAADQKGILLPWPLYLALHAVGMIGQGFLLIPLAHLNLGLAGMVIGGSVVLTLLVWRFAARLPLWLDMTLAMFSLGGLGMNFGWWMDLRFDPAIRNGMVEACCLARKALESTDLHAQTHWMYWMMLLLGVPAMYLLRRTPFFFDWRKWCCTGMLLLGVPAMCFGMWAGAQLAAGLPMYANSLKVLASYGLMMGGMCAGMLVVHALELAFPQNLPGGRQGIKNFKENS